MKNRKIARQLALQRLFAAHFHTDEIAPTVPTDAECANEKFDIDYAYSNALVDGVLANQAVIDAKIQEFSPKRKVERFDTVELNILRVAVYEMQFSAEKLDPKIAINEAVNLAKTFGSDSGYKLVNAILDHIAKGK